MGFIDEMKPADIFGLIVRLLGLGLLCYSVWYLFSALYSFADPSDNGYGSVRSYLISGGGILILSLLFLKGAGSLTNFTYPEKKID